MSALTDLFSAMATKIRSKTGTATTYTPLEMVQDGIDDVYDAGVEAGTPTLTGDASASDVKSGKTFYGSTLTKQTGTFAADTTNNSATATTSQATKTPASGKYFADFTVNPQQHSETYTPSANTAANDMGAVHNKRYVNTSGMIVPSGNKAITANGTGIDVSNFSTASVSVSGTPITPSDSNPPAMTSGTMYTPSANGYAYASQITPASKTETTLWTNSAPTSDFTAQAVTLSQSIDNFDYIKFKHASVKNQTSNNSFIIETIYSKEDVRKCKNSSATLQMALCGKISSSSAAARRIWYVSDTELSISDTNVLGTTWSGYSGYEIPLSIVGIKYTGV